MRLAGNFLRLTLVAACLAIAACNGTADSPSAVLGKIKTASMSQAAAAYETSVSGTTIPSATQIVDSGRNIWTVSGGVIYENGALAGYSKAVTLLVYENDIIYQENSAGGWWSWDGSTWLASSHPPAVAGVCGTTNGMAVKSTPVANLCSVGSASSVSGAGPWAWSCSGFNGGKTASCAAGVVTPVAVSSPGGTSIPPASHIIDSGGSLWTVSAGVVYRNGATAGYSRAVTLLLYDNNIIYQENSSGGWWSWTGSSWVSSRDPRQTAPSSAPLTISGNPATSVVAGQPYNFVPSAGNPSGGALSFSINSTPAWAMFNKANGALTGTPSAMQSGNYANIVISVSSGSATAALAPFSIAVTPSPATTTGSASLSWAAPTHNTNGTPLTDLAGYTIYYGTSQSELTQTRQVGNASAISYVLSNLSAGTYYFAIAAYTTLGTESARSPVGSKTIQ